jgi:hypothetical protein
VTDSEALARGLGAEAVARLLRIMRDRGPSDVHVLLGPVRAEGRRSVEVVMPQRTVSVGEAIPIDTPTAVA